MKIPISDRLLCCASLIGAGAKVADVGCDHGYLGIYLLREGNAAFVAASDLRPQPLKKAKVNAQLFNTADRMTFSVADGLTAVPAGTVDTVVCAGMGGDCIIHILEETPWVRDPSVTLILQPQTSGNDLRRWLGENGFSIQEEKLVRDSGFLYFTIRAVFGGGTPLTPGQQYLSPQLLACGSDLLPEYFDRVLNALDKTVAGISRSKKEADKERIAYYQSALDEVREMRKQYDGT